LIGQTIVEKEIRVMKKFWNERTLQGTIEYVNFPNRGIMHVKDEDSDNVYTVVVKNSVPGQQVEVTSGKKRGDKIEAGRVEVISKSPLEIESPCPYFGQCGGCTWLNLSYEDELKLKERQVRKLITEALPEEQREKLVFEGIKPSPKTLEYRNKMEFTFGDEYKDGPLALGQHRRGGFYDIITVRDCRIVDSDFRAILKSTIDFWGPLYSSKQVSYYRKLQHTGYLRHLLVRKASHTGEILVDLVTTTQEQHDAEIDEWMNRLTSLELEGRIVGVLHTSNDSIADVVKDEGTQVLTGKGSFTEELLGLMFNVTPFSFFQTNSYSAEVLYETAREYLNCAMNDCSSDSETNNDSVENGIQNYSANERNENNLCKEGIQHQEKPVVFDLYTGTGTIAQLMAPAAKKVIGVEIVEEAVEAAKENARANGLENCEFIAGDVLKVIDSVEDRPDIIILDPPRDGIHPKALPKILAFGVPYILYISCKPSSLARDIPSFTEAGYHIVKAVAVDQFPWTASVETVVLLSQLHEAKHP